MQDLRGLAQQADLRVVGVDVEELGHGGIVLSAPAVPGMTTLYSGQRVHGGEAPVDAPGRLQVERCRRGAATRDHGHAHPGPVVGHMVERRS